MFLRILILWSLLGFLACTQALFVPGRSSSKYGHRQVVRRHGDDRAAAGRRLLYNGSLSKLYAFSWFNEIVANLSTAEPVSLERTVLKQELIDLCRREKVSRSDVEAAIQKLAVVSPTKDPASNDLIQKEWKLLWTTEKEINVFYDWNVAADVTQTILDSSLVNAIEFKNGGSLIVRGSRSASEFNPLRSDFAFTAATLDFGVKFLPVLQLPPLGKGWFDAIYLDDELRVDTNSRNDIVILTADK
ncbi:hypothetical protein MPSEU_001046900 [Mayamaea pseudoterrestris]|nr:hypothetical protein MPSEU_001046900 [Mayamaea pseudoterrestris]